MTIPRVALLAALLVVASSIAAGAAAGGGTPLSTDTPTADEPMAMGPRLSAFMQASAGQADGAVENGMWDAAFENASEEAARRALVERRTSALDGSLAELRAERTALREAYQNGSLDRATYRSRLSAIVGRLAALGDGIETASERAATVGVNTTRLDELRAQARELGGAEISRMARNLTGGQPPGHAGVFDGDRRGGPADRGPATNRSGPGDRGQGPGSGPSTAVPTATPAPTTAVANETMTTVTTTATSA